MGLIQVAALLGEAVGRGVHEWELHVTKSRYNS